MPRRRLFKKPDTWEYGHDAPADEKPLAQPTKRRAATILVYGAMFFAGAAFTAFAGDKFAAISQEDSAATEQASNATTTDAAAADNAAPTDGSSASSDASSTSTDGSSTSQAAPESAPAPDASATPDASASSDNAPAAADSSADAATSSDATDDQPEDLRVHPRTPRSNASADPSSPAAAGPTLGGSRRTRHHARVEAGTASPFVLLPKQPPAPKPELEAPPQYATVWLDRALPDPTPPALRLSPAFARRLKLTADTAGVDWALLLGILRAKGGTGHDPAAPSTLSKLAGRLGAIHAGGEWATALAYDGSASFADRALALARYDRAVGLNALVRGLEASKTQLEQRILSDPAISIYPGGRDDIAKGKVDVRVLAMISYLHESFGEVTVSSLISGHRLYARPGVISAHIYGRAVDIAALGGTSILGHQEPGGVTEQAVRDILLLPAEVMPKQVISLLGLGGPSFPLADHYNHIHVGY